jgi:hypothetical protein
VAVQFADGASVVPQVVVERKGHWLVMRRMVSGVAADVLVSVRVRCADWPEGSWPKLRTPPESAPPVIVSVAEPMP